MSACTTDTYVDSMLLMVATATMDGLDGVDVGGRGDGHAAVWRTWPRRVHGRAEAWATRLGANDLVLAVTAQPTTTPSPGALAAGREAALAERAQPTGGAPAGRPTASRRRRGGLEGANVAIVSVPGEYAALEAHHALSAPGCTSCCSATASRWSRRWSSRSGRRRSGCW